MSIKITYSALTHEITILTLTTFIDLACYCIRTAEGRVVRKGKITTHKELQYISTSGLPVDDYVFSLMNKELQFHKHAR